MQMQMQMQMQIFIYLFIFFLKGSMGMVGPFICFLLLITHHWFGC